MYDFSQLCLARIKKSLVLSLSLPVVNKSLSWTDSIRKALPFRFRISISFVFIMFSFLNIFIDIEYLLLSFYRQAFPGWHYLSVCEKGKLSLRKYEDWRWRSSVFFNSFFHRASTFSSICTLYFRLFYYSLWKIERASLYIYIGIFVI